MSSEPQLESGMGERRRVAHPRPSAKVWDLWFTFLHVTLDIKASDSAIGMQGHKLGSRCKARLGLRITTVCKGMT
jgi:hypothetical protein